HAHRGRGRGEDGGRASLPLPGRRRPPAADRAQPGRGAGRLPGRTLARGASRRGRRARARRARGRGGGSARAGRLLPRDVLRRLVPLLALAAGCGPALPDPEAPGARVLRERCVGCHRLYAPGSMTLAMWKVQTGRMREEFARRGMPWLVPDEERALLDYLAAHAGRSERPPASVGRTGGSSPSTR